jgi:hypothetical protein
MLVCLLIPSLLLFDALPSTMAREARMNIGGGAERQMRTADQALQKRLGEAIQKTAESEHAAQQRRDE